MIEMIWLVEKKLNSTNNIYQKIDLINIYDTWSDEMPMSLISSLNILDY